MIKWEYDLVSIVEPDFHKTCNKWGNEGWILVGWERATRRGEAIQRYELVFRRQRMEANT